MKHIKINQVFTLTLTMTLLLTACNPPMKPATSPVDTTDRSEAIGITEIETEMPLDEYLISVSVELADKIRIRSNVFISQLVGMPVEAVAYAADYDSIIPDNPRSVDVFSINATADEVFRAFLGESEYRNFVAEAPGDLTRELLAEWYDGVSERAPYMIPQWINNRIGDSSRLAGISSLSFSSECRFHKDFSETRCVVLNYDEGKAVWVIFTESSSPGLLHVNVMASYCFEELENWETVWEEFNEIMNRLSENREHYE